MGLLKKQDIKDYWSMDKMITTPFFRKMMSRDKYHNMQSFFHLCDNATYPKKGDADNDPRKKLGVLFSSLCEMFPRLWTPRQHISIDEGAIPFKGHVAFKCFNTSKPDKHHIKTFKVVDSSNNYCLHLDLYVGNEYEEQLTVYGATYDRVMKLVKDYLFKSYFIYMDHWYSSPYLYYNLRTAETGATGTCQSLKGFPVGFMKTNLFKKGDSCTVTYDDKMVSLRIHDRKVVTLMSTVYSTKHVPTGRKHWQTKEELIKPEKITMYNKYMGEVDVNNQLLKYSGFSRRSLKRWKVAFRLLNLSMANAYILYKEWHESKGQKRNKILSHTDYRMNVVKQLLATVTEHVNVLHDTVDTSEFSRLGGKHFIEKIQTTGKSQPSRTCKVCYKGDKVLWDRTGAPPKKKYGSTTTYWCKQCHVELCVGLCFELYHTHKDHTKKYVELSKLYAHCSYLS